MNILKILSILLSFIGLIGLVMGLSGTTKRYVTDTLQTMKSDFARRKKNRYVSDYINIRFSKFLDDTYKYSRFFKTKTGKKLNTSFRYFIASLGISFLFGIIFALLSGSLLLFLLGIIIGFGVCYAVLFAMRAKNKSAVGKDIEVFLQLLGNYSTNNTEITSVFMQIAPKMRNPLADCLVECVAESQNIEGKKIQALENLANKIEHEKFREIIYSLSVAEKYSSNFTNVVAFNKGSLNNFTRARRKKRAIVRQNSITMFLVTAILFVSLSLVGSLTGTDVYNVLFTTPVGLTVTAVAGTGIVYYVLKIIGFGA